MTNRNSTDACITITVLNGQASIQDLGRPSAQHLGFSASGAADEFAFIVANKLVNNSPNSAALEVVFGQLTLTAKQDVWFALTGADCQAFIQPQSAESNHKKIVKPWQAYQLKAGQQLVLQQPKQGLISYISFAGGIDSLSFGQSQAQTLAEQALELTAPRLATGSILALAPTPADQIEQLTSTNTLPLSKQLVNMVNNFYQQSTSTPLTLRFIPSKLYQQLSNAEQEQIYQSILTIGANSNRMGYQLSGLNMTKHSLMTKQSLLSKPVCYGTIQLPSAEQAIVLMKERQTIGGYPSLGVIMQTDLFRLSQKRPGEKVRLVPINVEQAQQQLLSFYTRLE